MRNNWPEPKRRPTAGSARSRPARRPSGPSGYSAYKGLRLSYRVKLEQEGGRIVGRGQKWTENGRTLPSSACTPITVTGTMDGRKVELTFTEQGTRRSTRGGFSWTLSADRTALRGSFWSNAADTSGRSLARRMP